MFKYPNTLSTDLIKKWNSTEFEEKPPKLPNKEIIDKILEIAYHASLLTEESRPINFRIAFYPKIEANKEKTEFLQPKRWSLIFNEPRDFKVSELLRLSPATDPTKVLICIETRKDKNNHLKMQIWGLLDSGSSWWKFIHGESDKGYPPPNCLTITSNKPGHLSISRGGEIVLILRNGQVNIPTKNVINEGPIGNFFEPSIRSFYNEIVKSLGEDKYDPEGEDDDYPERAYREYLERVLFYIKEAHHGGTLIVVPNELNIKDSHLTDCITIKYPASYDIAWNLLADYIINHRKYYDLHFPFWDGKKKITKRGFQKINLLEMKMDEFAESLTDSVRFLASLSEVDGALVITDHIRLIGFGAEVVASSSTLSQVKVATDAAGKKGKYIPIDTYGTRHRSAFRFCSSFEQSLVFIISQDGGVKAVKRVGSDVILWPDINLGFSSI